MKYVLSRSNSLDVFSYLIVVCNTVFGIIAFNYAEVNMKYNQMLMTMIGILIVNIIFCIFNFKKRMILFLFYLTIFLFLISRILIPAIEGNKWWERYSIEANCFAMRAIIYSIVALAIGVVLLEVFTIILNKKGIEERKVERKEWVSKDALLKVVRIILIICMLCFFIREFEKLLFMRGRIYEDYFSLYSSQMPFVINFPASIMPYFLCAFLALKPTKKESFIWLSLYVISSLPMLKIGVRNGFVLNCIFAFVYYFLRDIIRNNDEKKWIGKVEKGLIVCVIPALLIFLGAYNYVRADQNVGMSPMNLIVDFAYKQGTTYDTLLQGYTYEKDLPMREEQIYTLGTLTDNFFYSSIGKRIFDLEDIGDGNSIRKALNGHTFSHAISYVVMGKDYIAGGGRGSSYIIENYLDGGYPGVVLFSLFLGVICAGIPVVFGKRWILSTICLNIITNFFFTARAESTAFLTFLISYKFWVCILGVLILGKMWMFFIDERRIKLKNEK